MNDLIHSSNENANQEIGDFIHYCHAKQLEYTTEVELKNALIFTAINTLSGLIKCDVASIQDEATRKILELIPKIDVELPPEKD